MKNKLLRIALHTAIDLILDALEEKPPVMNFDLPPNLRAKLERKVIKINQT